jgi:hypothetical protein
MALGEVKYKWGDATAVVTLSDNERLGVAFKWDGKIPATFTRARMQSVEPLWKDPTLPELPGNRLTFKHAIDAEDSSQSNWIANILNLFNVAARQRGIITRTASPDFSFRTTPPDYSVPEVQAPA